MGTILPYKKIIIMLIAVAMILSTGIKAETQGAAVYSPGLKDISVDIDYKDIELKTAIKTISYTYGLNVVEMDEIKGTVSLVLHQVSLSEALKAMLGSRGYTYTQKNNIIYISSSAEGEDLQMEDTVIPLHYLQAEDASAILSGTLSSKGSMKVATDTNSLFVTDREEAILRIKKALEMIDIPPIQVVMELKIIDIDRSDAANIGVSGGFGVDPQGYNKGLFNKQTHADESLDATFDIVAASTVLTGPQFALTSLIMKGFTGNIKINAIIENSDAEILASPTISTLSGKEASILIGEKYPYLETSETDGGTKTTTSTFVDIGTVLTLTPTVSPGGYITVEVKPEVSSVGTNTTDAGPSIITREANATIRMKDGETAMIGGLIHQNESITVDKIPILGDIPLIGWMFSGRDTVKSQRELVIFITPHIIPFNGPQRATMNEDEYLHQGDVQRQGTSILKARMLKDAENLENEATVIARGRSKNARMEQSAETYLEFASRFPDAKETPNALKSAAEIYCYDLNKYYIARGIATTIFVKYTPEPIPIEEISRIIIDCNKNMKKLTEEEINKKQKTKEELGIRDI